jgi:hypothetical protein
MSAAITIVGLGPGEARYLTWRHGAPWKRRPSLSAHPPPPTVAGLPTGPAYYSFRRTL